MKKIVLIVSIIGMLFTFTACNKFLDVYPDEKLLREQVLGSRVALHNVLNGVYMDMMDATTYGASLTTTTVEILAQRYDVSLHNTTSLSRLIQQYNYTEREVDLAFGRIWRGMYRQMLQINYFIGLMHETTVNFPEHEKNMLLGEAYGLRAMHHFDLLRLFGPVPELANDQDSVMPYNDLIGETKMLPLLPTSTILEKIMADLKTAEAYLEADYIKTDGVVKTLTVDPIANFYLNRNHRMNYYAVKALQARVLLWAGKPVEAAAAARAVINAPLVQQGRLFSWVTNTDATRPEDPDRVFSSEIIFGYRNRDMYNNFRTWFAGNLRNETILNPNTSRLEEVYNEPGDLRFILSRTWQVPPDRGGYTCFKYAEPRTNQDTTFAFFQPLIRISEMYYIIAEAEQNATYLEAVRAARQLWDPINTANLSQEIEREYAREFWAEGQLFFFYKRNNVGQIPNANTPAGEGRNRMMLPEHYRIPLPIAEQDLRR